MTVRECIEELQKLDQDRNIWIEYDSFALLLPIPSKQADSSYETYYKGKVKVGDYIINAS